MTDEHDSPAVARPQSDLQIETVSVSMGLVTEDIGTDDWELMVFSFSDDPPLSTVMDYALGLAVWTARNDAGHSQSDTGAEIRVETPVVCLVGLALYAAAEHARIYEVDRASLPRAIASLSDDQRARAIAALRPGRAGEPTGHLREYDRDQLAEVLQAGHEEQWSRWREDALHILVTNTDDSRWPGSPPHLPTVIKRLTQVRAARVRRCWYDHPELAPFVEDTDGRQGMR